MRFSLKQLLLILFCLCSYQTNSQEAIELKSVFNSDEVKWVKNAGPFGVSGEAYLKLATGEYKGCAGFNIELLPASNYADERILATYGNTAQGQILMSQNPPKFTPDVKKYHEYLIKSTCDRENKFHFDGVPSGDYYLIAFVIWEVDSKPQGGGVMKKISVGKQQNMQVNVKL